MSKRKVGTSCIVIDASIAHAAGTGESRHPVGTRCREFLIVIRSVCHRMAWSEAIKSEWNAHGSRFAQQWLVSMMSLKKLRPVKDEVSDELRRTLAKYSHDQNVLEIMLKDIHLIEAAVATDLRVASRDEAARFHFRNFARKFAPLRNLLWVNPVIQPERIIQWLEDGAPDQSTRRLGK